MLQIATTVGGARVLSLLGALLAVTSSWVTGHFLYRSAIRREREREISNASNGSLQSKRRQVVLRTALSMGALGGPFVAALLSPLFYLPVVTYLMLVPVAYIDAGARDPSNPRLR